MIHLRLRNVVGGLAATLLLASGVLLASTATAGADPASVGSIKPNVGSVFTRIENINSLKCLEPAGESTAEFAPIVQVDCVNFSTTTDKTRAFAQGWQRIDLGNSHFRFQNQLSGFCFDAFDGAFNHARLLQGTCVPISNEEFRASPTPPALTTLQSRVGFRDTGFCIDVPGASRDNNVALQIFQCNGTDAQRFFVGFQAD